ncbi:unnamed protein product [Heligmosomoides polygyrus]|uniref:ADP,ATP carrier protein n=1 Tax=Heligmosomoides polygyrus TaxID=6339 RepID=A0A183FCV5_HELPZ|nr:unnamed protein product [Heligmosomoides polygyrus]
MGFQSQLMNGILPAGFNAVMGRKREHDDDVKPELFGKVQRGQSASFLSASGVTLKIARFSFAFLFASRLA